MTERPLTLREAAELYGLTVSTLRTEAGRGRLDIFRIGRRDYVTRDALSDMVRKCQDAARHRDFISTASENNGLSETERVSSAQAALNLTVTALKQGLPRISGRSTRRNVHRAH